MASEIEICNLALSRIGAFSIDSLDEKSKEARECKRSYGPARDQVLSDYPWNFSTIRADLALLSGVEPVGFEYAYAYPSNCLKARGIWRSVSTADPIPFEIVAADDLQSKMIITDEEDAVLEYTAGITVPNLFSKSFIDMLSYRLASDLAIPITKKSGIQSAMLQVYMSKLLSSQNTDATEGENNDEIQNDFIAARE